MEWKLITVSGLANLGQMNNVITQAVQNNPYAHTMPNGDAVFFWIPYNWNGIVCLRVKADGTYCHYKDAISFSKSATPYWSFNGNSSYIVNLGNGLFRFLSSNGYSAIVHIPDEFLNGGQVQIYPVATTFTEPCAAGAVQGPSFYDFSSNKMLVEFYKAFGASADYWANVYQATPSGLLLETGGYITNSPNDPLNKLQGVYGYGLSYPFVAYSQDQLIALGTAYSGSAWPLAKQTLGIKYDALACGVENFNTYAYTKTQSSIADVRTLPNYSSVGSLVGIGYNSGTSNISGLHAVVGGNYVAAFDDKYIYCYKFPSNVYPVCAFFDSSGTVIMLCRQSQYNLFLYKGTTTPMLPDSTASANYAPVLANFGRPVSALGTFKT